MDLQNPQSATMGTVRVTDCSSPIEVRRGNALQHPRNVTVRTDIVPDRSAFSEKKVYGFQHPRKWKSGLLSLLADLLSAR